MTKILIDEAVVRQALEALEANKLLVNGDEKKRGLAECMDGYYSVCFDIDASNRQTNEAITALRQALAEPEQPASGIKQVIELYDSPEQPAQDDPVAWAVVGDGKWGEYKYGMQFESVEAYNPKYWNARGYELHPLYTGPQAREWVGLTDEEFVELCSADLGTAALIRAIEAKLKEKNT